MSLGGVDAYALLLYFAAIHTMTPHATTKATKTAASAGSGNKQFCKLLSICQNTFCHTHSNPNKPPKIITPTLFEIIASNIYFQFAA